MKLRTIILCIHDGQVVCVITFNMAQYHLTWTGNPGKYNCTFPAMIDDWRMKWNEATDGETDRMFPFGFVQVKMLHSEISSHAKNNRVLV